MGGWRSGQARCMGCGHEWVVVAPVDVFWFECPKCGCQKGQTKYPVMPPDEGLIWRCRCGSTALYATPEALRCCNCGLIQKPFD